jgi:hypothetical protein
MISFGDTNSGFQAGTIHGPVNAEFHHHLPPGKRRGLYMIGANDGPSYPLLAIEILSSEEGCSIKSIRNALYQVLGLHSSAWAALGKRECFGRYG